MACDDGVGRGDSEDGDALEGGAASEQADGDLSGGIARQIMVAGNEGPRNVMVDHFDAIGLGIDDYEIVRSEEHTSELQSLMRISYAVFCLKKKKYYIVQPC